MTGLASDHRDCDVWCVVARRPSPLDRPARAPQVACVWCGAAPGFPCRTGRFERRLALAPNGSHPSRLELVA